MLIVVKGFDNFINIKNKRIVEGIFLLLGVGGAALGAYWIATAPELDPTKLEDTFSSTVYDKYDMGTCHIGNRNSFVWCYMGNLFCGTEECQES